MTVKFVATVALVAVLGWSGSALAAGSKEAGQAKALVCGGCHGMDGNSVNPEWPSLASQHASYITKQVKNFKANERANPLMTPMAMSVATDQDLEDLAAYFASQKLNATGETDPSKLKLGERVYRAGNVAGKVPACASCHGPAGAGMPAQFPRIGGQYAEYTEAQLKAFRDGARANDPNKMMRMVAIKMTDAEIKAVADYIAGLR